MRELMQPVAGGTRGLSPSRVSGELLKTPAFRAASLAAAAGAVAGCLVALSPVVALVLVLGVALAGLVARRAPAFSRNVGWSAGALSLLLLVSAGRLDLEVAGLGLPVLGTKEGLLAAVLLGLIVVCLLVTVGERARIRGPRLLWLAGAYGAAVIVSAVAAGGQQSLWGAMWALLPMLAFVVGIWWYRETEDVLLLFSAGAIVCVLAAASGLVQALAPKAFNNLVIQFLMPGYDAALFHSVMQLGRITSVWAQPTPYAMFLSALLPVLGFMLGRWRGARRLGLLAGLILALAALFLTGARTALLAGIVGLVISQWKYATWSRRLLLPYLSFFAVLVLALFASILPGTPLQEIAEAPWRFFVRENVSYEASWVSRSEIYGVVLNAWLQSPVAGVGPGNVAEAIRGVRVYNSTGHSFWLQQLAEVGVAGLLTYLFLLLSMVPLYIRAWRRFEGEQAAIVRCVAGISLVLLLQSFGDNSLLLWQFSSIFWLLQGVVVAMLRYQKQEVTIT